MFSFGFKIVYDRVEAEDEDQGREWVALKNSPGQGKMRGGLGGCDCS